jgi:predicted phosphoadenosine phosphosulfate sulfurtransferase
MKGYIDTNVYEEAKKRLRHIINTFDKLYVSFSGGKDSLASLHLVEEVYREMGIKEKVNVYFRDEELIPDDVIEFVQSYYHSGKYNFYYYCVPLRSQKFLLGKTYDYIQWDPNRKWIRPMPDFALKGDGKTIYDQYSTEELVVGGAKGKIAFITGVRADESLIRFRSCVNKKNENYINATGVPNVKLCKPIYDWTEKDVFKYFYDNDIRYCGIYDLQMLNNEELRVSTPLHAESAKRFGKIRTIYPQFYQQLVDVFPEMLVQDRYWNEFDRYGIMEKYEHSWEGILRYIKEQIDDPRQQLLAKKRLFETKKMRENKIKREPKSAKNFGGFPLLYVFKTIIDGGYKRVIQPKANPTPKEIEYEKGNANPNKKGKV